MSRAREDGHRLAASRASCASWSYPLVSGTARSHGEVTHRLQPASGQVPTAARCTGRRGGRAKWKGFEPRAEPPPDAPMSQMVEPMLARLARALPGGEG